ncbi:MAG: CHAD domain-containing protein [Sneathiellaceae bacterium]
MPSPDGHERELKLTVSPSAAEQVRRSRPVRAFKQGRALTRHLRSVYFDSADQALRRSGMTLRVRHIGARRVQTVKAAPDHSQGLAVRREWECDVEGDLPDLAAIGDTDLQHDLARLLDGRKLQAMFESDIRRTAWQLRPPAGGRIELALDIGVLAAGDRRLPVYEVELELKDGPVAAIFDIAAELGATVPFAFECRSKADRGFALAMPGPPAWLKAKGIALAPQMTTQEAFVAVAGTCLAQAEANEAAARDGRDPEGVHQLRVACRRLRSAFSLFRPVLPPAQAALAAEIKWFAGELGAARDWDVFLAETLAPLRQALPGEPDLEALQAAGERCRRAGYDRVRAAIDSPRYTAVKLELRRWLADPDWHRSLEADAARLLFSPVVDLADLLLERRAKAVRKLGSRLATLSLPQLHELRIRGKKLRYATEFFASLYPGKKAKAYSGALARLQDVLGVLNDSVMAHDLLQRAAAADGMANATFHARVDGLVTGWCAAQSQARLGSLAAQWKAFSRRGRFWHLHPAADLSPALRRARPPVPALPAPRRHLVATDSALEPDDKVIQLPAPNPGKDQA